MYFDAFVGTHTLEHIYIQHLSRHVITLIIVQKKLVCEKSRVDFLSGTSRASLWFSS